MQLNWRAISESEPGPIWAGLFHEYWPDYHRWWVREGAEARPGYWDSVKALKAHMPEMMPLYDRLCELAGGTDHAARFLSFYCPPPYLSGCSQAIWPGAEPMLVRNYDYSPHAFDSLILHTAWQGRRVMGTSDGLWGLVDGINDAGLAVSLTFGGRRVVGDGFGVPLIATNHQERVEWASHARFTATVERERFLLQRLTLHVEPQEKFIKAFLRPPLYSTAFTQGFGTLYTAVYRPRKQTLEVHWPRARWELSLKDFQDGARQIITPEHAV